MMGAGPETDGTDIQLLVLVYHTLYIYIYIYNTIIRV